MQPVPRLGPRTKDAESKGHEFESSLAKGSNSENANLHTYEIDGKTLPAGSEPSLAGSEPIPAGS